MSDLAGKGVFATGPIRKDEIVCFWGGKIYTGAQVEKLSEKMKTYILQVEHDLYIGPPDLASADAAEMFNHSCEPNLGFKGSTCLVAMRDIKAGEELTFDYAMAETYDQDFDCGCGSSLCRKKLLGTDHNLPDIRKRYEGYFSYWLEKEHSLNVSQ